MVFVHGCLSSMNKEQKSLKKKKKHTQKTQNKTLQKIA